MFSLISSVRIWSVNMPLSLVKNELVWSTYKGDIQLFLCGVTYGTPYIYIYSGVQKKLPLHLRIFLSHIYEAHEWILLKLLSTIKDVL